jgi:glyoxalase family protein
MSDNKTELQGIHHVTAITADARENIDFYTRVLGLRMVKLTVNFDDPSAYHLYFGDELGRPGTALTFFSWPGARHGKRGVGQAVSCSFSVPENALGFWVQRLEAHGIKVEGSGSRFDEEFISFLDPDGLALELAAHRGAEERPGWSRGPVKSEYAIRGFHHVTISVRNLEPSAHFITGTLGFKPAGELGDAHRFVVGPGGAGAIIDVMLEPNRPAGLVAVGTIHHVAWRTPDNEQQIAWQHALLQKGVNVTPIIDRHYFKSIYFREPGGVLFEIATDPPGFTVDESPEQFGTGLKLPPWMEKDRANIERSLPSIELKRVAINQ